MNLKLNPISNNTSAANLVTVVNSNNSGNVTPVTDNNLINNLNFNNLKNSNLKGRNYNEKM